MISIFPSNTLKFTWVPLKRFSFLQPSTILLELKYDYQWIKVTMFVTRHRRIPSKIKPRLFTSCLNRTNDRTRFEYWGGRKILLLFHLYGLMRWVSRLYIFFFETVIRDVLTKKVVHFDQLRHWQKTNLNRRLLIGFF